jgi:hypothetical protein
MIVSSQVAGHVVRRLVNLLHVVFVQEHRREISLHVLVIHEAAFSPGDRGIMATARAF